MQASPAHQVRRGTRGQTGPKVRKARREMMVQPDPKGHKAIRGRLDRKVRKVIPVGLQGPQARRALRGMMGRRVRQARKARRAMWARKAR